MKKWIFLLLLYSPIASSDYVIITACGEPVTFIFNDDSQVHVAPILSLDDRDLFDKLIAVLNSEEGKIISVESQYPIVCPKHL